jgi:Cu(I)-responsive transcriptional regulator
MMIIGEAAEKSGVSAKAIRYYESIGLIARAARTRGNYRAYPESAVGTLRFIHRARNLGFQIEDIETLLNLWNDRKRKSAQVKALARNHIAALDAKIAALISMRAAIAALEHACHGDQRPQCPILDELAQGSAPKANGAMPIPRLRKK